MTIMTAPGSPTIAYRANTTAHDSDTIAMPGKARLSTTLIRSPCRARPTAHDSDSIAMPGKARRNIFRVSRRCFPLYSGRHHHAARQASRRRTPGISTTHAKRRIRLHARNYFRTRAWRRIRLHAMRRIRTAYGSNYFPS